MYGHVRLPLRLPALCPFIHPVASFSCALCFRTVRVLYTFGSSINQATTRRVVSVTALKIACITYPVDRRAASRSLLHLCHIPSATRRHLIASLTPPPSCGQHSSQRPSLLLLSSHIFPHTTNQTLTLSPFRLSSAVAPALAACPRHLFNSSCSSPVLAHSARLVTVLQTLSTHSTPPTIL